MSEPIKFYVVQADSLWNALKRQCCVNPKTAFRCVMVTEKDLKAALNQVAPERTERIPQTHRNDWCGKFELTPPPCEEACEEPAPPLPAKSH